MYWKVTRGSGQLSIWAAEAGDRHSPSECVGRGRAAQSRRLHLRNSLAYGMNSKDHLSNLQQGSSYHDTRLHLAGGGEADGAVLRGLEAAADLVAVEEHVDESRLKAFATGGEEVSLGSAAVGSCPAGLTSKAARIRGAQQGRGRHSTHSRQAAHRAGRRAGTAAGGQAAAGRVTHQAGHVVHCDGVAHAPDLLERRQQEQQQQQQQEQQQQQQQQQYRAHLHATVGAPQVPDLRNERRQLELVQCALGDRVPVPRPLVRLTLKPQDE